MIKYIIEVFNRATLPQMLILGFASGLLVFAIIIGIMALYNYFNPKKRRDFNKRYGRLL